MNFKCYFLNIGLNKNCWGKLNQLKTAVLKLEKIKPIRHLKISSDDIKGSYLEQKLKVGIKGPRIKLEDFMKSKKPQTDPTVRTFLMKAKAQAKKKSVSVSTPPTDPVPGPSRAVKRSEMSSSNESLFEPVRVVTNSSKRRRLTSK